MAFFTKKESEVRDASVTPVDQVLAMKKQGLSNSQIIQTLQRNGNKSFQIFDAMNQADMMEKEAGGQNISPGPQPQNYPIPPIGGTAEQAMPEQQLYEESTYEQAPAQEYDPEAEPQEYQDNTAYEAYQSEPLTFDEQTEKIEEIAEAIIDEKWEELIRNVTKIADWKERTDAKLVALEQQFKDLKDNYDNMQKAVIGRVSEYDQNLINVGTEIKAMERVFQKILPGLTENVSELGKLTEILRKPDVAAKLKK